MKTITSLKDFTAKNAKILLEFRNEKCIMGITFYNDIYVASFYNIKTNHEHHKCVQHLKNALYIINNWLNIVTIDDNYTK